jgi:hypothetical protein
MSYRLDEILVLKRGVNKNMLESIGAPEILHVKEIKFLSNHEESDSKIIVSFSLNNGAGKFYKTQAWIPKDWVKKVSDHYHPLTSIFI